MNALSDAIQLRLGTASLLSFLYSGNLNYVFGCVYSEIYAGVCHLVFEATPRIRQESLEETIRKRQNEYAT
jgi:hypothetical protein